MSAGRVHVVGSVNMDVALPVERLPHPGVTIAAGDPVRSGGGKGANAAVAAARDGGNVRLIAAIGHDEPGDRSLADLRADGVRTEAVVVLDDRPTGLAMICVDPRGENFVVVAGGANGGLLPEHVMAGLQDVQPADVCVVNFEIPEEVVAAAAARASSARARVVMNPSPVRRLAVEVLNTEPLLVLNAGEVLALTGEEDRRRGARLLQRAGCEAVVVTLGADGAEVLTTDGDIHAVPAFAATAVDTTGAGDTFTGVLAAGLARGQDLVAAAQRAAAAAALSTQGMGARTAMPARSDVDRLLAS